MSRISTTSELLKRIKSDREIKHAVDGFKNYTSILGEKNPTASDRATKVFNNPEVTKYIGKLQLENIKDVLSLNIIYYREDEHPKYFDEAVSTIERAIKNIKSPFKNLIDLVGVTNYDIAYSSYTLSGVNPSDGKEYPSGTQIDISVLLQNIEVVSDNVIKQGITMLDKDKPFFFQKMKV